MAASARLLFLLAGIGMKSTSAHSEAQLQGMFALFKAHYNKLYTSSEERDRFAIFTANMATARQLNAEHGYNCTDLFGKCGYGVTKFSDWSPEEFKARMLGYKPGNRTRPLKALPPSDYTSGLVVQKMDWRAKGKVTPIKDQNPCGVCWAFSATGTVESAYAIATGGSPPILAPQEIIECDGKHQCNGKTSGGNYEQAWEYLESHGGLALQSNYPTTCCNEARKPVIGQCKVAKPDVKVTGIYDGPQNEDALAAAVASQGPFSIAVAADAWQHWSAHGTTVMTGGCTGDVDHAVAIVGFDKTAKSTTGQPLPYWIVRNQWGTDWGSGGYIHLKMGLNMCKLTTEPAIARVSRAETDVVV